MDGRSWAEFCDRLKAAGSIVLAPDAPATQIDRAEGWRYLSRLTRVGLEMMLEHAEIAVGVVKFEEQLRFLEFGRSRARSAPRPVAERGGAFSADHQLHAN